MSTYIYIYISNTDNFPTILGVGCTQMKKDILYHLKEFIIQTRKQIINNT